MPERTCIITGDTLPPHRMIRFVAAPDGYAVADQAGCRGEGQVTRLKMPYSNRQKRIFQACPWRWFAGDDKTIMIVAAQLRARALSCAGLARRFRYLLGGSVNCLLKAIMLGCWLLMMHHARN